jgi:hypothetical protein
MSTQQQVRSRSQVDDPALDDWLADEVDWDSEGPAAPRRPVGEPMAAVHDMPASHIDLRRLDLIRRRRLVALGVLLALIVAGVALAVLLAGGDEPTPTPTTTPVLTPPAASEPPPPATTTADEPPATLTVALPESGQLAVGDSGEEVEALQTALAALELEPGAIDGVFGAATQEAVRAFQQANDLPTDGIVGQATADALNAELAEQGITG